MPEIENVSLGLYGTEHSKCNHLMTVSIKGLKGWVIFDEDSKIVAHHKLNRNSYNSSMNGKGQNPPTVCTKTSQTDYVDAMTSLSKLVKYIY